MREHANAAMRISWEIRICPSHVPYDMGMALRPIVFPWLRWWTGAVLGFAFGKFFKTGTKTS